MEVYARVRRAVQVDGMSVRQASREFGLSRKTIRRMLQFSLPPGYQRKKPVARPKLGPWLGVIDQILVDDQSQPKKQRHTAKRIWDRLKDEHGFTGGYTIVKDYVRQARLSHKEVFVPWRIRRETPRRTSVKHWWSLPEPSRRPTSSASICRIRTTAL